MVFSESTERKTSRLIRRKLFFALGVVVITGSALFLYAYAAHLLGFGSCGSPPANIPGSNRFLLVISFYGYNGSKYHAIPWPRMNVTLRQYVTIRAWNNDTQSHGFAITHYFEQGEYIRSSDFYDLTFQACQLGSFAVYDPSFVTAYPYLKAEVDVVS